METSWSTNRQRHDVSLSIRPVSAFRRVAELLTSSLPFASLQNRPPHVDGCFGELSSSRPLPSLRRLSARALHPKISLTHPLLHLFSQFGTQDWIEAGVIAALVIINVTGESRSSLPPSRRFQR